MCCGLCTLKLLWLTIIGGALTYIYSIDEVYQNLFTLLFDLALFLYIQTVKYKFTKLLASNE